MRSLSRSFGVCLINEVLRLSLRICELRSPKAYRRFSSAVSTTNALTLTGLNRSQLNPCGARHASYFLVPGSKDTIVKVQLIRMSVSLTVSPSLGAFATCIVISKLLRPVAYVTLPDSWRSQISSSGWCIVIRSQEAVTVVTSSPVCLYLERS